MDDLLPQSMRIENFIPSVYGSMTPTTPAPSESGAWSGALQQAIALGGQYLSRRIDIDLQTRAAGAMPAPYRGSSQYPITGVQYPETGAFRPDLTTRGVQAMGGLRMGDLLPFLVVGGVLFLVLGKR
jgi:hypothetical protein